MGSLADPYLVQKIGPVQVIQSFGIPWAAGALAFWILGYFRSRTLRIRGSIWSAVVSATVNLEPGEPDGITDSHGEPFFIAVMLTALATLSWILGIFAVGATSAMQSAQAEASQ